MPKPNLRISDTVLRALSRKIKPVVRFVRGGNGLERCHYDDEETSPTFKLPRKRKLYFYCDKCNKRTVHRKIKSMYDTIAYDYECVECPPSSSPSRSSD